MSPRPEGKPLYKHDCSGCRYLGTGVIKCFGDEPRDFYVCGEQCPSQCRTILVRWSSNPSDYTSGELFECIRLTTIDRVALFNGLELTPVEEKRLLRLLASMWKDANASITAYGNFSSAEVQFGKGNIVFGDM